MDPGLVGLMRGPGTGPGSGQMLGACSLDESGSESSGDGGAALWEEQLGPRAHCPFLLCILGRFLHLFEPLQNICQVKIKITICKLSSAV